MNEFYNFNKRIDRKNTASIKYDRSKAVFGRDDILPMWVADMDFETADFIFDAIQKRLKHKVLGYTFRNESFNKSFVNWAKDRYNWDVRQEWLDFSPGVVAGLAMSVLAFTEKNDKIIIQTPVYPPFYELIKGNGRIISENPLKKIDEKYVIDFDNLIKIIDDNTKMIIISNPHNPVGRVWTKDELLKLGQIAMENNLIIVSDDIHSDFIFSGHNYTPIASLSEELANRTITVMSPSKTFNIAGLSTSIVIIPNQKLLEGYRKQLHALHLFLGNIFGAEAFTAAYSYGHNWLNHLILYLEENRDLAVDFIKRHIPKIKVFKPEGTFLLWLDFKNTGLSHEEIKNKLINEALLGFNDGLSFGKQGEFHFRMNFATQRTNVITALNRLKEVFG